MKVYVALKLKCLQWRKNPEVFPEVVLFVLEIDPLALRKWADEFEVSTSTLQRWAHGAASPPQVMQRFVVNRFQREATALLSLDKQGLLL